jgi:hypothetical protein
MSNQKPKSSCSNHLKNFKKFSHLKLSIQSLTNLCNTYKGEPPPVYIIHRGQTG